MAELSAQPRPARTRDVPGSSRKGARGSQRKGEAQQATAAGLDLLRVLGWLVLHDVDLPGDDGAEVDHVLAGPSGVYVVNTVSWSGAIHADGDVLTVGKSDHSDALVEIATAAAAVRMLLGGTPVAPLLCFERLEPVAGFAGDVALCASENILDLLTSQPQILDAGAVARTSRSLSAAFRPGTGTPVVRIVPPVEAAADDTAEPEPAPEVVAVREFTGPTLEELVRARSAEQARAAEPVTSGPGAPGPGAPELVESEPVEFEPVESELVESEPAEAELEAAQSELEPAQSEPVAIEPVASELVVVEPEVHEEPEATVAPGHGRRGLVRSLMRSRRGAKVVDPTPVEVAALSAETVESTTEPVVEVVEVDGETSAEGMPTAPTGDVEDEGVAPDEGAAVVRLPSAAVAEAGAALWRSLTEPDEAAEDVEAAFVEAQARQREIEDREAEARRVAAEVREETQRETDEIDAEVRAAQAAHEARAQAAREALEQAQREAFEAEAREIADREEAERLEAERFEAERLEAERLEAERLEAERLEAERLEQERVEREARERAEREEAERLEAERLEAERLEAERLEAERLEAERLEREARKRAEREEAERLEQERLEAERVEREARERAEREEAERLEAERLEQERLEAERLEQERLDAEARERAERKREKAERKTREKTERKARAKAEREAREQARREEQERLVAEEARARAAWESRLTTAREAREREALEAAARDAELRARSSDVERHPEVRRGEVLVLGEPEQPSAGAAAAAETPAPEPVVDDVVEPVVEPDTQPVAEEIDLDTWEPAADDTWQPEVLDDEPETWMPHTSAAQAWAPETWAPEPVVPRRWEPRAPLAAVEGASRAAESAPVTVIAQEGRRRPFRGLTRRAGGERPGLPRRAFVHVAVAAVLIAGVIVGGPRLGGAVAWGRQLFAGQAPTSVGTLVKVAATTLHPAAEVLAGTPVDAQVTDGAGAGKGKHLVAVPFRVHNAGTSPWTVPIGATVAVKDNLGVSHPVARAVKAIKGYPLLPAKPTLAPGQDLTGYAVFAVPNGRTVASVSLGLARSGEGPVTWQVAP